MLIKVHFHRIVLVLLLLVISGCGEVDSIFEHRVSIKSTDLDVDAITLSTCSTTIKLPQATEIWTFIHSDCSNSDYRIKAIYKDGYILEESLGYIPGGVDIDHNFFLENRKLSLQGWNPELENK